MRENLSQLPQVNGISKIVCEKLGGVSSDAHESEGRCTKMSINASRHRLWKEDIARSVDLYNNWFMEFAPQAYRNTRVETTFSVEQSLQRTQDLKAITPSVLKLHPSTLPTLRMAMCPPLARDRLIGLADVNKNLVLNMEEGRLPRRMSDADLMANLQRVCSILSRMLDRDIFPWLTTDKPATDSERHRAATIVADRLCGAVADPIIRNAQERRQLRLIEQFLETMGYRHQQHPNGQPIRAMEPGTFSFRSNVVVGVLHRINIPIDIMIQPKRLRSGKLPILLEAKSAGDFTNVNKRRKEEATKIRQLRETYGKQVKFVLFLCGYFDTGYLGYEAGEGIDWIWEHRIEDMNKLGI